MSEKYGVSIVRGMNAIAPALKFRQKVFRSGKSGLDFDKYDESCHHFLMYDLGTNELVCVFRALVLEDGGAINDSYSSQFYELDEFSKFKGKMLEIGRFCVEKRIKDPAVLRLAWSELAKFIIKKRIKIIFGCTSFDGVDKYKHIEAFSLLKQYHLSPISTHPKVSSKSVFEFAKDLDTHRINTKFATLHLPPLLRLYLRMGAKVSGAAIFDFDLQTTHVFTSLNLKKSNRYLNN